MQVGKEDWESISRSLKNRVSQMKEADFESLALAVFQYQFAHNPLYHLYVELLGKDPSTITQLKEIPFLPIEFFKSHLVQTGFDPILFQFESSGTTGQIPSKHVVCDPSFYQQQAKRIFEAQYGSLQDYHIFALLPSYLERSTSSLVFMMDHFIKESRSELAGFYLNQYDALVNNLKAALQTDRKIWLMGVTFGLLDWVDTGQDFSFWKEAVASGRVMVMETGGMKGRREEWLREEVHAFLKGKMHLSQVASEYGMTELFSQAYAEKDGIFNPGVSMRVMLREVNDPFGHVTQAGRVGGIKVIDLANIDSCSFIETKDLGSLEADGLRFKVLGRFDNSEQRGCNLMLAQGWGTSQDEPSS
ncbi:LuxE/PaaK family acyltransferase [Aquirufa rosea]|uniref:Acyl transferase n=1 Tax=Aquirufa rosea TaxID=2509241 RepID=A0A4Q1C1D6_9BACT|nr:acyl transferase [Aquirufa rosea]RXK50918.1 acyl transferase [Aquirufa rosea]